MRTSSLRDRTRKIPSLLSRETVILLPNNQRQHRTSLAPKDVLPLRICANYCAPCQPLLRDGPTQTTESDTVFTGTVTNRDCRKAAKVFPVFLGR